MTGATEANNGTPDDYFDGDSGDLWVESKVITSWPRNGIITVAPIPDTKKQPRGRLTVLQAAWIKRRYEVGGNAYVVLGLPDRKAVIIDGDTVYDQWRREVLKPLTLKEVAAWIQEYSGN